MHFNWCFSLEHLNVCHMGVSEVYFPACQPDQKTRLFSALKQLHLSENNIRNVSCHKCYSNTQVFLFITFLHIFIENVNEGKVKCALVQALRLCTGCMAHRGSRGITLPFLDHGTRRG
jgi:hypothetical protein